MIDSALITGCNDRRAETRHNILARLDDSGKTLHDAIRDKGLYFRVSLTSTCNLACPFCHNEGAPRGGCLAEVDFLCKAIDTALSLGFDRIQFTGGEPLLHPHISKILRRATQQFPDVGITTNGVLLERYLPQMIDAEITRIHISLQQQSLSSTGTGPWKVPSWLGPILNQAEKGAFILRLNLPVQHDRLNETRQFLKDMEAFDCNIRLFSVLPTDHNPAFEYPLDRVLEIARTENKQRHRKRCLGRVTVRKYFEPSGIRCGVCPQRHVCQEQSRSLRLGADKMLRPCLATREWDIPLQYRSMAEAMEEATVFAIDF
ncbi:MAG: radical SAM protein [Proteobacteria bacterium]|nr:radical SAM protein [Pseudomonadota bacterium]MBU4294678.1 radical SAM protein [Pseudomonadota bacterium]MCG2748590.1 radical SAM protein [Desulfobulbaceae bacterium]